MIKIYLYSQAGLWKRTALISAAVLLLAGCRGGEALDLTVENPLDLHRPASVVELPLNLELAAALAEGQGLQVRSGSRSFAAQIVDSDRSGAPDYVLILDDFKAGEKKNYRLTLTAPETVKKFDAEASALHAMFVPQRMDDFAWENDRVAFRMYGPALQATGEISSGIDPWCKSVDYPILEKWYAPGVNYHTDQGEGGDFYKVGRTGGVGGSSLLYGGTAWPSANFTEYRILANGPYRILFELDYAPWKVGDAYIASETKRIQLDRGSHFNLISSRTRIDSGETAADLSLAAALPRLYHPEADFFCDPDQNMLLSLEVLPKDNGTLASAVFTADNSVKSCFETDSEAFAVFDLDQYEATAYYAGFYWSKKVPVSGMEALIAEIEREQLLRRHPLRVRLN